MSISLALTNYNRSDLLFESFAQVLEDDRISEIIISDDFSDYEIFRKIMDYVNYNDTTNKIKLYRNAETLGMSRNKAKAISYATNEWVIIFDSDNKIDSSYLDAIPKKLDSNVIYCPSFAKPNFDYRKLEGVMINRNNVHQHINSPQVAMLLNTSNYLVHRDSYLSAYVYSPTVRGSDTVWMAYNWLQAGGSFYVVPGLEYFHLVHKDSGFLADAEYNLKKAEETRKLIEKL